MSCARARALDRTRFHAPALDLEKALRRPAKNLRMRRGQVGGKRRRTDHAQRLVGKPGIPGCVCGEALRQVYLIAITVMDVAANAAECIRILLVRHVRRDLRHDPERRPWLLPRHGAKALEKSVPLEIGFRIAPLPHEP